MFIPQVKEKKSSKGKYLYGAARLLEFTSGWVIEFRYLDPDKNELVSHRERFQRIRKQINCDTEARKVAKKRCQQINLQLSQGWTPYGYYQEEDDDRIKTYDALERFFKSRKNEFRPATVRTYASQIKCLQDWLAERHLENLRLEDFDSKMARKYLDYVSDKGLCNRSYNNTITSLKSIWNWFLIDREYVEQNPFLRARLKKVTEKIRQPIPLEWNKPILDYCRENDPVLGVVCNMVYSSYIRPSELCLCKVEDVDLYNCVVYIPGGNAKNHHYRIAPLAPDTVKDLKDMGIEKLDGELFLIGKASEKYGRLTLGGKIQLKTPDLDRNWRRLRKAIDLPDCYHLYSWRDSGLSDMLIKGVTEDELSKVSGHLNKWQVNAYKAKDVDIHSILKYIDKVSSIEDREKELAQIKSNKISSIQRAIRKRIQER